MRSYNALTMVWRAALTGLMWALLSAATLCHAQTIASPEPANTPHSSTSAPPEPSATDTTAQNHGIDARLDPERGLGSWYGPRFHGRKTASGERFDMNALTAAHRSLPLHTYVRITLIESGAQVVARISDRGPFVKTRIIDLSKGAAQALGMLQRGLAEVLVEPIFEK